MDDWTKLLDACADEFSPRVVDAARNLIQQATGDLQRANLLMAAICLGPDVMQPKTPGEHLRHDIRTAVDQLDGIQYGKSKRRHT